MNQILTTLFFTAIYAYTLNSSGLQVQWENLIWKDCSTDKLIEPLNCDNNDQKWKECYQIPKYGMCVTSAEKFQNQQMIFQFKFNKIDSQQPTISINNQQQQAIKVNENKLVLNYQVKGQLKIKVTGADSILEDFQLSEDCSDNCKTCDSNYDCSECQENYSLLNYECVSDSCFNDLGILSTQSASLVNAKITQNYEVNISFDVNLGTCLIPRAYLIKNINTNQIEYVLPKNQVQIQNSNQLSFYITFDQIYKNCQELKKNETILINQCYIGIALTLSKISQYNLILIGQIQTNLQTQSSSVSTQTIEIPDDNIIQINAANEISQISFNKDILIVKQTVFADTQFDNINLKQAYMLQDNEKFDNLDLQMSLTKGNEITYRFKVLNSDIDYNKKIELLIQCDLLDSNRMLIQDRSRLEIKYSVSLTYELKQQELQQINKTNNDSKLGKYLIIGSSLFVGGIGLIVMLKQFIKKGKKIQMNEDNQ